jgi:hypothetical protein
VRGKAQVAELLSSKCEVLSSTPHTTKKILKKKKKQENMTQSKEQTEFPEVNLTETDT